MELKYDCYFLDMSRKKTADKPTTPRSTDVTTSKSESLPAATLDTQIVIEANSGEQFVRRIGVGLDPVNAPRLHAYAWNLFLGERRGLRLPQVRRLPEILSLQDMRDAVAVYFAKVSVCYGFIEKTSLERDLEQRWLLSEQAYTHYDAVLCGVIALGCLFSEAHSIDVENDLVETARVILESAISSPPDLELVSGWILRVAYLRMVALPHVAWMASSITMHMIEAAGLHKTSSNGSTNPLYGAGLSQDDGSRQRILGIAQHMNTWLSFDLGRERVDLHQVVKTDVPPIHQGDCTHELLGILRLTQRLDPHTTTDVANLEESLRSVLLRHHSIPPTILAQCNVALCICRRLKVLDHNISNELFAEVMTLGERALGAVRAMIDTYQTWHHITNVPFQLVCIILAFDSQATHGLLRSAMECLNSVYLKFNTEAAHEALRTASSLISLHQRRKAAESKALADIVKTFSATSTDLDDGNLEYLPSFPDADLALFGDLIPGLPNLLDDWNQDSFLPLQWP